MMENPTDPETTFGFAVIARRAGDLEGAVGALERMLIFNPDLPVVHFGLARLYARLGSGEVARRYFHSALRYDPPPEIRAEIEAGLARLDQAAGASSFSGSVYLGLRYQSNANAGPDEPTVRVGGLDARLAEEFLDRDDTSTVASARLAHRYDLGRDPAAFIVSEFSAYAAMQSEIEENDVELLAGTIGPEFVRSNGVSLRPFVRAELVGLGGAVFYRSFGAGIAGRGAVSGTRNLLYFFDAGAFRRNFEPSDRSPTLDRRDGESYQLGAGLRKTASPTLRVSGTVGWEQQNSRAKSESYTGGSAGGASAANPQGAVWRAGLEPLRVRPRRYPTLRLARSDGRPEPAPPRHEPRAVRRGSHPVLRRGRRDARSRPAVAALEPAELRIPGHFGVRRYPLLVLSR